MKFLFLILLFIVSSMTASARPLFNEIMPLNNFTIADEDGEYESWVELYNNSDDPVRLNGYGLSNRPDDAYRWVLPDITLAPDSFLLVWLSGKDRRSPDNPLHSSFDVEPGLDTLFLTAPDGHAADTLPVPDLPTDVSYGRSPDGAETTIIFKEPTPGDPNIPEGRDTFAGTPEFSVKPGFYDHSVRLELLHDDPDATIYYTTDGSVPDSSANIYSGPITLDYAGGNDNHFSVIRTSPPEGSDHGYDWIPPGAPVDKGHIIRAVAKKPDAYPSAVASGTWFPGMDQKDLPVLSVSAPKEAFFDNESGIYVPGAKYDSLGFGSGVWGIPNANYHQRGREWEREASFEWFEDNRQLLQQDIGIRIHGGGSRSLPQKSLRLYARSDYGQSHLEHQVFPDQAFGEFKRLILRNSGQDFYRRATMFRDAFMQELISDLYVQTQAYRPTVLFLNGEYWGIHNIRERYDKHFFERVYGVPEQHLDYLENRYVEKEGSNTHYLEMLDYIEEHDLADDEHLEHVSTMMDFENFIDYNILQLFFRNKDWPGNNNDYWRYSGPPDTDIPYHDGRWRWLVYDLDFGFGLQRGHSASEEDMLQFVLETEETGYANAPWATFLLRSLLENEQFKTRFLRRFNDLLITTFQSGHMTQLIDEMAEVIRPEIGRHIERWSHPPDKQTWDEHVNIMRYFAETRPEFKIEHLQHHFDTGDLIPVVVNLDHASGGVVTLNSITLQPDEKQGSGSESPETWSGRFFENVPVELEAKPSAGYRFSHWEINGDSIIHAGHSLTPDDKTTITPVFERDYEDSGSFPEAFVLTDTSDYSFSGWSPEREPGTYPSNMAFVYMDEIEPSQNARISGFTSGAYDLDSRTRITGLDDKGFAFINTDNLGGNPGYPGRRLGGALLALNTESAENITVEWTAGTITPNSREYGLRLQYRIGNLGPFQDATLLGGQPVTYIREETPGHQETIGPVILPDHLSGQPHVELLWRYYHTGVRHDSRSGARTELNIASITVSSGSGTGNDEYEDPPDKPDAFALKQNYPNPFNNETRIPFELAEASHVVITLHDVAGRRVATIVDESFEAGTHEVDFVSRSLASGVYLYRMQTSGFEETLKMVVIQ
ncbi:CotH kinase family protein [Natronogracilivirga saccharolytica]|uniref:CotH kinase family protein n=1 Tax=Natronogracilivirga saccharolytica TaxID=2812953 RepID=A0A8J7SAQ6_9BACT|nr:CotH kinase family protein [Natronogracilivirga saccharolytica]MBP3193583.1 CotH kinase family protein [Natronogracilivirga saccharolytica]